MLYNCHHFNPSIQLILKETMEKLEQNQENTKLNKWGIWIIVLALIVIMIAANYLIKFITK